MKRLHTLIAAVLLSGAFAAAENSPAAQAVNQLGLDLQRRLGASGENLCVSPYSIQCALAMTYAGADGATRAEMAKVLHFPEDESELHASFAALRRDLTAESKKRHGKSGAITLEVANRLFGDKRYDFRKPFRALLEESYGARLEALDFVKGRQDAARHINRWVEGETNGRIRDIVRTIGPNTKLILANAVYFKAPWAEEFPARATRPQPFHRSGRAARKVPTMVRQARLGYGKFDGFTVVSVPYVGGELQFVALIPDEVNGLAGLERTLTAGQLARCAALSQRDVALHLPKFRFEPPVLSLAETLQALGMKTAFDVPHGSADFGRMSPGSDLFISEVAHKTFIAVDEKGTEAAAATTVHMLYRAAAAPVDPISVKADRPFLFAIQHRASGACLFLGRVADPS